MAPYRSCAPPSTICSARDSCWRGAFRRRVFWSETLLDRGAESDVAEAEAAIERLAAAPADGGSGDARHLAAAAARSAGAGARRRRGLRDYRDRYRAMATTLGFEGHIAVGRGDAMTGAAPSGVVTFLFTDVEGSTRRWEADADAMRAALAAHDEVLRSGDRGAWRLPVQAHRRRCVRGVRVAEVCGRRRYRLRSGRWSCRCGWGWRPAKPSCETGITSVRCSTVRHG